MFIGAIRGSSTPVSNPWKYFARRRRERRGVRGTGREGLTQRRKARNATDGLRWVTVGRLSCGNVAAFAALREAIRKTGISPGGPTPLRRIDRAAMGSVERSYPVWRPNTGRGVQFVAPSPSVFIGVIRGSSTPVSNPGKYFARKRRERRGIRGTGREGLTQRRKARNATDGLRWVTVGRLSCGNVAAFASLRETIRKTGISPGGPTPLRRIDRAALGPLEMSHPVWRTEHWPRSSVCFSQPIRVHRCNPWLKHSGFKSLEIFRAETQGTPRNPGDWQGRSHATAQSPQRNGRTSLGHGWAAVVRERCGLCDVA